MTNRFLAALGAAAALTAFVASPALAQSSVKVGTLTCDVSAGIGLLISQQQTMTCAFRSRQWRAARQLYRPH